MPVWVGWGDELNNGALQDLFVDYVEESCWDADSGEFTNQNYRRSRCPRTRKNRPLDVLAHGIVIILLYSGQPKGPDFWSTLPKAK